MPIPRELRRAIEAGRWAEIEDAWLARIEANDRDLAFFADVARSMVGAGEAEQAQLLLQLLDDHYEAGEAWRRRLQLLEKAGEMMLEGEEIHRRILECLRRLYRGKPSLEGLIDKVGLERGIGDLPKIWSKVRKLHGLMQFETGTPVQMEGKGVGRVAEVNLALDSLKIEFDDGRELRVGFAAAPKLLTSLPEGHFLRRRLEDPDSLRQLRQEQPAELLRLLLESVDRPLNASEIREALQGLVDESEWASWWAEVRKHPQVVPGGRGRQTYAWAGTSDQALEELRRRFEGAKLAERLKLLAQHHSRDPELADWMVERLQEAGRAAAAEEPELALAAWSALDKIGRPPDDPSWEPSALLAEHPQPARLVAALDDRALRERAVDWVREAREDWPAVYRAVLDGESDPRLLDTLFDRLNRAAPDAAQSFVDDLLRQPRRRAGAFVWLAARGADEPTLQRRNPLTLLRHLIDAFGAGPFSSYRSRLLKLWEEGAHTYLLDRLSDEQAPQAEELLERAPIEEFLRQPYLNALHLRFSHLSKSQDDVLYATQESIEARRLELKKLLEEEIPANRKAIEVAREMGDLRENFEYKAARQRHEFLSARAANLDRDLRRVRAIDPEQVHGDKIRIGSRVELADGEGGERSIAILGPWESHPEEGVFSCDSEVGQRMLGAKPDSQVELEGQSYRIQQIGSWFTDGDPAPPPGPGSAT